MREFAREKIETMFDWGWKESPEGARLAVENLAQGSARESDEFRRIQILGILAIAEPNNPDWPSKLYKLAASPNKEVVEAAERALIHAGK
jgi:outer membrane PBP1 activator LpoA protein